MARNFLVKSKILKGMRYEKELTLKSYDDAIIKIHPISDVTLTGIQEKLNYTVFDVLKELLSAGVSEEEIEMMTAGNVIQDSKKFEEIKFTPKFFKFMQELCSVGIISEPDPDCPRCKGKVQRDQHDVIIPCPECDIRGVVDQLRGFATIDIGAAILGVSTGSWKDVEDFFTAKTARCIAESSAPAN
jgi:hypothetical protein